MKYFFTIVLTFFTIIIFSQEQKIPIEKSNVYREQAKNLYLEHMIEDDLGGYILLRPIITAVSKFKGYHIERYNKDLKLIVSEPYGDKETLILGVYVNNGKLYVIEGIPDVKKMRNKTVRLVAKVSDLAKLNFVEEEFFSFNLNEKYGNLIRLMEYEGLRDFIKFSFSVNKMSFTINFHVRDEKLEYHYIVAFDNNLQKIHANELVLDTSEYSFEYDTTIIDETDQSVYLIGRRYVNLGLKKARGQLMRFEVYKLNTSITKSLELDGAGIKDGSEVIELFPILKKDKLYLVSLYKAKKDGVDLKALYQHKKDSGRNGVLFYEVNKDDFIVTKKNHSLFTSVVFQFGVGFFGIIHASIEQLKDIYRYKFKEFNFAENGDFVLTAEQAYIDNVSGTGSMEGVNIMAMGRSSEFEKFKASHDILTIRIDGNGDVKNAVVINKYQMSKFGRSGHHSFTSFFDKGEVYYLINARGGAKKLKKGGVKLGDSMFKKLDLMLLKVDEKGSVSYKNVLSHKDTDMRFFVEKGLVDRDGKVVLMGKSKNETKRLIKLKL